MAQVVLAPIDIDQRAGLDIQLPVAAGIHLYPGTLIARDANGNATYAGDVAGLDVIGRCQGDVDNTAGQAGALSVNVRRGVFAYVNSSVNPLTAANVGTVCYVQDEQTVAANSVNLVKAGLFLGINPDTGMAWVDTVHAYGPVPNPDTITPLAFANPPTQANLQALQAALIVLFKQQGLII